mmetsp:Transcript_76173/g.126930  ORF Transcript_76173/g.126930 Transcript_76173/m.126930 type:complete len:231 (+) Transcript_76173:63-755(+)
MPCIWQRRRSAQSVRCASGTDTRCCSAAFSPEFCAKAPLATALVKVRSWTRGAKEGTRHACSPSAAQTGRSTQWIHRRSTLPQHDAPTATAPICRCFTRVSAGFMVKGEPIRPSCSHNWLWIGVAAQSTATTPQANRLSFSALMICLPISRSLLCTWMWKAQSLMCCKGPRKSSQEICQSLRLSWIWHRNLRPRISYRSLLTLDMSHSLLMRRVAEYQLNEMWCISLDLD